MANIFTRKKSPVAAPKAVGMTARDPEVAVLDVTALPRGPVGDIAIDGAAGVVVATNPGDRSISVLDADLGSAKVVAVGGEPTLVAVAEDRAYVATASLDHEAVTVVDTHAGTVIARYPLAFSATAMTISPDGKRLYVGRTGDEDVDVAVIDITAERIGTIGIGYRPGASVDAVRLDDSGRRLYVATTSLAGSALLTVDTDTVRVVRRLRLASPIRDLALGRDGLAYVLRSDRRDGGSIDVVDLAANTVTKSVAIGGAPTQLVVNSEGTRAYVVDYDRVAVFNTLTGEIVDELTGDGSPACVAVRADGRRLYVADFAGVVTSLAVPPSPMPLTYSQFVATDRIIRPDVRELTPAV
ncbi:YncE family protein [Mycolicibacterium baixiangningiae]|uniref:YncE family protein n=1 Tax=Mycolicibacterium baixiangningiae TaxID=2761578 RepID=UPI0018680939|nr:YncE family protein [Mycolicibacterium baixiangningiae]